VALSKSRVEVSEALALCLAGSVALESPGHAGLKRARSVRRFLGFRSFIPMDCRCADEKEIVELRSELCAIG
jgi:hypothetical protein